MDTTLTGVQPSGSSEIPISQVPEATCSIRLSERDASEVMATAEKPPAPNDAALQAAKRFVQRHG
jgi:uncharacterized protein (DUF1778 family)